MKCLRFALPGMVLIFCLFGSCSFGKTDMAEEERETEVVTEEEAEGEENGENGENGENEEGEESEESGEGEESEESEEGEENGEETEDPKESLPKAVYLGWKAVLENEVIFEFSLPVMVVDLVFSPEIKIEALLDKDCMVTVLFEEDIEPGQRVEAVLQVEDQYENIIDVEQTFFSKNNRVPKMLINELRTEYSKPKAEFIEFKMLSDGNLGGLRVFAAGNYRKPMIYQFDPVEVKSGEYVVLHLRTLDEACKDEYGEDLTESGGADSSPTARDFWIPESTKLLRKTDVVYVLDQEDRVLDAVMIAENADAWKGKEYFSKAAGFLFDKGAWSSAAGTVCDPANAVDSSKATATRSICRDETAENTRTAADWYVTVTSGNTPGKPNNKNRFSN